MSTVGLNEDTIQEYIREQESTDIDLDKLSVKEGEMAWTKWKPASLGTGR